MVASYFIATTRAKFISKASTQAKTILIFFKKTATGLVSSENSVNKLRRVKRRNLLRTATAVISLESVDHQYSLNFDSCDPVSSELVIVTDPIELELLQDVRGHFGPDIEKLCFVDTETTGAYPDYDRIIEIALIKFKEVSPENWRLLKYVAFVNPEGRKSHPGALRVHKIPDGWLFNARTFREQAAEIKAFMGTRRLVAQNSRFDQSFFANEFRRACETYSNKWFCSRRHFKKFNPYLEHYGLEKICGHYGFTYNAHRAEADALAIIRVFHKSGAIRNRRFRS